jgi:hypothetical protein
MANGWYYTRDGKQFGPITSAQLKQLAAGGRLQPTDLVWKAGMSKWVTAGIIKGLFPANGPKEAIAKPTTKPETVEDVLREAKQTAKVALQSLAVRATVGARNAIVSAYRDASRRPHQALPIQSIWILVGIGVFLLLGLSMAITLAGLSIKSPIGPDGTQSVSGKPARSKAAGMTRRAFRETVMSFKAVNAGWRWDGVNRNTFSWRFLLSKDFFDTFGEPAKKQTIGDRSYWYWLCSDGTVQVIIDDRMGGMMRSYRDGVIKAFEEPGATLLRPGDLVPLIAINEL